MRSVRGLLIAGVVVNLLLIGVAAGLEPKIFGGDRTPVIAADVAVLLAYAMWATWAPVGVPRALAFGSVAALIQFGDLLREFLTDWSAAWLLAAMLASLLCFALAGQGWRGGVTAAIACMLVLWLPAWAFTYAATERIGAAVAHDPEYVGGSLKDLRAYTVWNTLNSALSHAIALPILGAIAGAIGGAVQGSLGRASSKLPPGRARSK